MCTGRGSSSSAAVRKPTHPRYIEMVSDAIAALKERSGSSHYAIAKHMEGKHSQLPSNFKRLLLNRLKNFVDSGKIVKVKGSFKLPPARSRAAATAPEKKKPAAAAKPKLVKSVKVSAAPKTAVKSKTKSSSKPKAVAKPAAMPKAAAKRRLEAKEKPAKASRTLSRISPGKKVAASKPGNKAVKKGTPVKPAKRGTVKSPARRTAVKRGKK